jgi:hypothetical protein
VSLPPWPSSTVSSKDSTAGPAGAGNVGRAVAALDNVTAGPPVWTHAKVSGSSSASLLPLPSSVTRSVASTSRSGPASATGALFGGVSTSTVVVRSLDPPSLSMTRPTTS